MKQICEKTQSELKLCEKAKCVKLHRAVKQERFNLLYTLSKKCQGTGQDHINTHHLGYFRVTAVSCLANNVYLKRL